MPGEPVAGRGEAPVGVLGARRAVPGAAGDAYGSSVGGLHEECRWSQSCTETLLWWGLEGGLPPLSTSMKSSELCTRLVTLLLCDSAKFVTL